MNIKERFKRFFTLSRSAEGFTLVELIIVIVILAILAGIAIPAYSQYVVASKKGVEQNQMALYHNAFVVACVSENATATDVTLVDNMDGGVFRGLSGVDTDVDDAKEAKIILLFNGMFEPYTFEYHTEAEVKAAILYGIQAPAGGDEEEDDDDGYYYKGQKLNFNQDWVDKYMASIWGNKYTSSQVLGHLEGVIGLGTNLDNERFDAAVDSEQFAKALGYDDMDAFGTHLLELALAEQGCTLETMENADYALALQRADEMRMNAVVMAVAKGSTEDGVATDLIKFLTTSENVKNDLKTEMGNDPVAGLTNTALTYALVNSYMLEKGNYEIGEQIPFETMWTLLNKPGDDNPEDLKVYNDFQDYLKTGNGQRDLAGLLASLDAVNSNSGIIGDDVLTGGFATEDINGALVGILGK